MKLSTFLGLGVAALSSVAGSLVHAQIYNEVTVSGSYGATDVEATDDESVVVAAGEPALSIVKTASGPTIDAIGPKLVRSDAGDAITYTFVITNDGNVTMTGLTPDDDGLTFQGETGTGAMTTFTVAGSDPAAATATLAPGESETFTAVYTLSDLVVYHAADTVDLVGDAKKLIANTAAAFSKSPQSTDFTRLAMGEAVVAVVPFPQIGLVKLAVLDDTNGAIADQAEEGETITYAYLVTNTGNVPLSDISVADIHEAANLPAGAVTSEALLAASPARQSGTSGDSSSDDTANDGVWTLLQPEDIVEFTYVHLRSPTFTQSRRPKLMGANAPRNG